MQLSIKFETVKFLKENNKGKILDISFGKKNIYISGLDTRIMGNKSSTHIPIHTENKNRQHILVFEVFLNLKKKKICELKRQPVGWEKLFAKHITDR